MNLNSLGAGTYQYQWKGVDGTINVNSTELLEYNVTKADSDIKLTLNGNREDTTISDGESLVSRVEELNTDEQTVYLYRNLSGTMKKAEEGSSPIESRVSSDLTSLGHYKFVGN